jgi:hypothetical protein
VKRNLACVLLLCLAGSLLAAAPAKATAKKSAARSGGSDMALGLFLGQPTGLSFRLGLGSNQSLEAKAAWELSEQGSFAAQANWLLEFPGTLVIEGQDIIPYVGGGAALWVSGELSLGIRIPFGLVYRFEKAPIELCLEVAPGMNLFPGTTFAGSGGLGVRYRF